MKKYLAKILAVVMPLCMILIFSSCGSTDSEESSTSEYIITEADSTQDEESEADEEITEEVTEAETETETETTTAAETTTVAETTTAETTTAQDGYLAQELIDVLMTKNFYISGEISGTDGMDGTVTIIVDGDNMRINMSLSSYKIAFILYNGNTYIANTSNNRIMLLDETAINDIAEQLEALGAISSSYSTSSFDIEDMMDSIDTNLNLTEYLDMDNYSEAEGTFQGVTCVRSKFTSEYGNLYFYSLDGSLLGFEVYGTDSERDLLFVSSAFYDIIPESVSISGFTTVTSVVNLFTS